MGYYIKLFPIQFELFWIPPLSSSVKFWKLADCLLQLIIGECRDITSDICYMTTMLRTFDHGKQYSIKLPIESTRYFLVYKWYNAYETVCPCVFDWQILYFITIFFSKSFSHLSLKNHLTDKIGLLSLQWLELTNHYLPALHID